MGTKPDDIPDDIWEDARELYAAMMNEAYDDAGDDEASIARALLAERLKEREACAKLIEEGFERPVGEARVPGHRSKNDYCPHQHFMYEDCEQCAVQAIRSRP